MKPYINLFTGICLALAPIFLCGMDGCSPTDEADPAVFVSASPADGSTLQESATIVATFDAPPSGLNVQVPAGVTFSVAGSVVTITGGFQPGPLSLVLTWDDGATVLNYTVPRVEDRYDGDSIIFEQGGTIYEGRVLEGVSEDEVLVRLTDGSDEVVNVNDIAGTLIEDHADLEVIVKLLGDRDKGEKMRRGIITAVYDNGVRKIEIDAIDFVDGRRGWPDVPPIRFVHEDTHFNDGGYLTLDEFADIIFNGGDSSAFVLLRPDVFGFR